MIDDQTWAAVTAHADTELDSPAPPEALAAFEAAHDFRLSPSHREFLPAAMAGLLDAPVCSALHVRMRST